MKDYKSGKSKGKTRGKGKSGTPAWVMLVSGLVLGGLAGVGGYVFFNKGHAPATQDKAATQTQPAPKKQNTAAAKPSTDSKKSAAAEKPRFEFYTLLPEQEVIIPDSEVRAQQEKIEQRHGGTYIIQVGSFRHKEDADSLKAQLALLGIEADVDSVTGNEETWHRVRVGPFTDTREMNRIRNRIHANKMNTMLVKVR